MQCPLCWVAGTKSADLHNWQKKLLAGIQKWHLVLSIPFLPFLNEIAVTGDRPTEALSDQRRLLRKEKGKNRDGGITLQLKEVAGERKLKGMSWQQYVTWLQYKESPISGSQSFLPSRSQKNPCSGGSTSLLTSQHLQNTVLLEVQVFYSYFSYLRTQRLSSWKNGSSGGVSINGQGAQNLSSSF